MEQILALGVEHQRAHAFPARTAAEQRHAGIGLQQLIEQEQGVGGLGGNAGDAGDGDMAARAPVHEAHVGVYRRSAQVETQRQLAACHLVLEQGGGAVGAGGAGHRRPGVRGQEQLRHHAQHAHLGTPHQLGRQGPVDHAAGVGGQFRPLEAGQQLGDDSVVGHLALVGQLGRHGDQLVELDDRIGVQDHVEGSGVAVYRSVDQPDARQVVAHLSPVPCSPAVTLRATRG